LLSTFQAAEYLGVPRETLAVWRMRKTGPRYSKIGRHVKYWQADLESWVESHSIGVPLDLLRGNALEQITPNAVHGLIVSPVLGPLCRGLTERYLVPQLKSLGVDGRNRVQHCVDPRKDRVTAKPSISESWSRGWPRCRS